MNPITPDTGGAFVRPDWTDPSNYAHLARSSLTRLAWEFLRRNPDYRANWSLYLSLAAQLQGGPEAMVPDPQGSSALVPLVVLHGRRWRLDHIVDPCAVSAKFASSGARVELPMAGPLVPLTAENPHGMQQHTRWLIVRLDLALPLNVIEAAALGAIRGERRRRIARGVVHPITSRAQSIRRYIEYLRILDAEAAGASIGDMGAALAPKAANEERQRDKRIRAALTEATRLQAEGYAVLPLLQPWTEAGKKK